MTDIRPADAGQLRRLADQEAAIDTAGVLRAARLLALADALQRINATTLAGCERAAAALRDVGCYTDARHVDEAAALLHALTPGPIPTTNSR